MTSMPTQDLIGLVRAQEILAPTSTIEGLPQRVFDAVEAVLQVDLLTYNDVNLETGEARLVMRLARPPTGASTAPVLRRFGYHPLATGLASAQAGSVLVPRFVSDPRLRALGVGNCCGDAEMKLNAALSLAESTARLVGISISRAVGDFDDHDYAIMAALQPIIVDAFLRALAPMDHRRVSSASRSGSARLTRRENEVLYWVAMGKTNEEIATIIGARPPTVKKHLEHVYEKLEVPNRTAAAAAVRSLTGDMQLVLPPAGA